MKPAKAAGKVNPLPAVVGAPSETAQKQTEANDRSLATALYESGNLREKWRVSAKPVRTHKSPTAADTDAELISKQLLAKVESLFENFNRFGNIEYFKAAEEWETLKGFFRGAGKDYAIVSHGEGDRRAWVKKKIRSDRDAIDKPKPAMIFGMRQSRRLGVGIEEVRRVLEKKLDVAMDEGMSEATKYIAQSETPAKRSSPVEVSQRAAERKTHLHKAEWEKSYQREIYQGRPLEYP
jgi:hypothetical protein